MTLGEFRELTVDLPDSTEIGALVPDDSQGHSIGMGAYNSREEIFWINVLSSD